MRNVPYYVLESKSEILTIQNNYTKEPNKLFERVSYESNSIADFYKYDKLYRVIGTKYGVDSELTLGSITEANQPIAPMYESLLGEVKKQEVVLDKEHNRTSYKDNGVTTDYQVNDMNQYINVNSDEYNYDNNGNLTQDDNYKYIYDPENRLVSVTKLDDSLIARYQYGANGRRISKETDGKTYTYYYDQNWNLSSEYIDGLLVREFTYADGIDKPICSTIYPDKLGIDESSFSGLTGESSSSSFTYYYHQNSIQNVLALTDNNGDVICRYKYDIDGTTTIINKDGNEIIGDNLESYKKLNEKLWQGRELDYETGLYYFRNRYYSPGLGRFISTDPLDYVDGMNLYSFVNGNVVNLVDPMGLYEIDVHQFLTRFLAESAGFGKDSSIIGEKTQELDRQTDSRNAIKYSAEGKIQGGNKESMKQYHFPSKEQVAILREKAFAEIKEGKDFKAVGEYLHALEDTYGHSKGKGDRNWKYYGGKDGGSKGHWKQGNKTDWTWRDPEKAMKMTETVYNELRELAKASGKTDNIQEWEEIKDTVQKFVEYKPELYKDRAVGAIKIKNTTAEGLTQKIKILDKDFELSPEAKDEHTPEKGEKIIKTKYAPKKAGKEKDNK